ncbi:MAG TPA: ATP-binding protein [Candidatus Limnocylindria bacterium]|nr:ATP-binding protein [Candidatus Limnocylindria bacterium]
MRGLGIAAYVSTLAAVALCTAVIGVIEARGHISNISMLYLLVVLASAILAGRRAAIAASVAAFLAFNWFFVQPLHTFQVGDPDEWLALLVFLLTAGITGQLAAQLRDRARVAAARERETVQLYEERERLRQQATNAEVLRRADELKTALLGAVSHDLRTPLASIIASAGSLRQTDVEWTPAEREAFVADIEGEARRLERIVANLLDLSRMESGTLRPERGWYDVAALVDDVLGRLRTITARHAVHVDISDDLPPVPLDYVEIDQVISNLIENAVRHTPAGTNVWITAERAGESVAVSVADDGPGVPAELQGRLFDAFARAGDRRGMQRGAGLGLAIARGLISAHGGTIAADARPGGGTVVRFTLPLRVSARVEAATT